MATQELRDLQRVRLPVIDNRKTSWTSKTHRQAPKNRKPMEYAGRKYESITALARTYGLSPPAVVTRLAKGYPLEVRYLRDLKKTQRARSVLRPTAQEFWKGEACPRPRS